MTKCQEFKEFALNVLGYREDEDWVALALDMDLRGSGATFEEALNELMELVEMQVSFAIQKGLPEMIWKPVDAVWMTRWAEARRERFNDLVAMREGAIGDYRAGAVSIVPPASRIAGSPEFCRVDA